MEIVILDGATVAANDLNFSVLEKFGNLTVYDFTAPEEIIKHCENADAVFCNKIIFTREIFEKLPKLKYVGLFATGFNNIDVKAAKELGITDCNAGSYSTDAVAQHTFGFILNNYTRIADYSRFVLSGGWTVSKVFSPVVFPTDEIKGKTLGIIGYGSIGKKVAEIARVFGMRVIVHTRTVREDGITEFVSLDELLNSSDIISLHCPLTAENTEMFNAEAFDKCKNGAYFINTARGGLVNEQALFYALESGKLSGAAVDVICTEPMPKDCILLNAKNITITPHSAWTPFTTRNRVLEIACQNYEAFLSGNPQNVVSK
ncbi:MAG: D-2-hydroxyacid dehydrogenase [Clostridia bacterium]|nr:D-2-hydroxyacid dehydrogenase [Clostridia bacterium]